jgi:uncharacterized protein (TIGR02271 family)
MSHETIVAVFETSAAAEEAARALEAEGISRSAIERHSKEQPRTQPAPRDSSPPSTGFFFWDMMFAAAAPHRDRSSYDQSLERGATVLAVTVSEDEADRVMSVLESRSPVELDQHGDAANDSEETEANEEREVPVRQSRKGSEERAAREGSASTRHQEEEHGEEDEEVIGLAEEELRVGKRLVNRGTTRIRRYVVETPVEKTVSLHDERVVVERRRPVTDEATGDHFTEKTVEVTETSEVPTVEKGARLKEEVVIRREGREREETIEDTVRREEIGVEPGRRGEEAASAEGLT